MVPYGGSQSQRFTYILSGKEQMESQQIKQILMRELPVIIHQDPEVRRLILELSRQYFADRAETENRFDRILEEMRQEREENSRKWEEQNLRWEEQNRRWEANQQELRAMREEQNRRWEENQKIIQQMLDEIHALNRKHDTTIGALGARLGLYTEQSFRNALRSILEESFGVRVINVVEYDDAGEVFGRPDQIELDLVIKDSVFIICEISSSMSKADMYTFERKARFYEKRHERKADRLMVISPMVSPQAQVVAQKLGIEIYTHAEETAPVFGKG
jgi:Uncharacterized conserved protein containing a coiled-coil domain